MLKFLRNNMKAILIILVVAFLGSIFYGLGYSTFKNRGPAGSTNKIASVNGEEIDPVLFNQFIGRIIQSQKTQPSALDLLFIQNMALSQVIDFTLIKQAAKKEVKVSRSEVDEALNQIIASGNYPSKDVFLKALKRNGMTEGKLRDYLKDEIFVQKYMYNIRNSAQIKPEDLREIRASHILLAFDDGNKLDKKAKEEKYKKAMEIYARLKSGEDFAKLAKAYSEDPGSAKNGGDLGFFSAGMMVLDFEKAALSLKPGEISLPVETKFGYHIIKVTNSRARIITGKKGAKEIEAAILAEKQENSLRRTLSEQKDRAKIVIFNPVLKANRLVSEGRVQEGLQLFNETIKQEPSNAYARLMLAYTYEMMGQLKEALGQYDMLVKQNPGEIQVYFSIANIYRTMSEKDKVNRNAYREQMLKYLKQSSLIAGDNLATHKVIAGMYKANGFPSEYAYEQNEISRIQKKEALTNKLLSVSGEAIK